MCLVGGVRRGERREGGRVICFGGVGRARVCIGFFRVILEDFVGELWERGFRSIYVFLEYGVKSIEEGRVFRGFVF